MTRNSDRDNAWPPNTLGAQEAEGHDQQLTPTLENNNPGLGEQMQNSNEVAYRCPQIYISPTSKYQRMDVKVGASSNRNPRQDQVTMRRAQSSGYTND